jgi:predicted signal transduction protein with EAL and GGDEF domain
MRFFDGISSADLERREMQLILLACSAILVLAVGLALFMYPAVFSQSGSAPRRTMSIAFFGFCVLSVLLAGYLLDRQATILRLRQQIREERSRASEALRQASAELLEALPNFSSFQDHLSMEYRRAAAAEQNLSILIISISAQRSSEMSLNVSSLGDAAKAIARKLREEDSIYLLAYGQFGVILPGLDEHAVKRVSARLVEGLTDASGINNRFSFKVDAIRYPEQVSSAHDLETAVADLLPDHGFKRTLARQAVASR